MVHTIFNTHLRRASPFGWRVYLPKVLWGSISDFFSLVAFFCFAGLALQLSFAWSIRSIKQLSLIWSAGLVRQFSFIWSPMFTKILELGLAL